MSLKATPSLLSNMMIHSAVFTADLGEREREREREREVIIITIFTYSSLTSVVYSLLPREPINDVMESKDSSNLRILRNGKENKFIK